MNSVNIVIVQPLLALIFGIPILFLPRLLNYFVAIYLIVIGAIGLIVLIRLGSDQLERWLVDLDQLIAANRPIIALVAAIVVGLGVRSFLAGRSGAAGAAAISTAEEAQVDAEVDAVLGAPGGSPRPRSARVRRWDPRTRWSASVDKKLE